jgi:hypothetical protein
LENSTRHRDIRPTVRYTERAPTRFKEFWKDEQRCHRGLMIGRWEGGAAHRPGLHPHHATPAADTP